MAGILNTVSHYNISYSLWAFIPFEKMGDVPNNLSMYPSISIFPRNVRKTMTKITYNPESSYIPRELSINPINFLYLITNTDSSSGAYCWAITDSNIKNSYKYLYYNDPNGIYIDLNINKGADFLYLWLYFILNLKKIDKISPPPSTTQELNRYFTLPRNGNRRSYQRITY